MTDTPTTLTCHGTTFTKAVSPSPTQGTHYTATYKVDAAEVCILLRHAPSNDSEVGPWRYFVSLDDNLGHRCSHMYEWTDSGCYRTAERALAAAAYRMQQMAAALTNAVAAMGTLQP